MPASSRDLPDLSAHRGRARVLLHDPQYADDQLDLLHGQDAALAERKVVLVPHVMDGPCAVLVGYDGRVAAEWPDPVGPEELLRAVDALPVRQAEVRRGEQRAAAAEQDGSPDLEVFVDPMCPFCWITAQWVLEVQAQRGLAVRWRTISLAVLNEAAGYEGKPPQYPAAHRRGLQLLRLLTAARAQAGEGVVGDLYVAMGRSIWEVDPPAEATWDAVLEAEVAAPLDCPGILRAAGLPADLAGAEDDERWDDEIRAETAEALQRVGGDVGTPILSFSPPDGPAFFGPVISEVPRGAAALELYDAVETLARWDGFAELKRSLRSAPVTRLTSRLAGRRLDAR